MIFLNFCVFNKTGWHIFINICFTKVSFFFIWNENHRDKFFCFLAWKSLLKKTNEGSLKFSLKKKVAESQRDANQLRNEIQVCWRFIIIFTSHSMSSTFWLNLCPLSLMSFKIFVLFRIRKQSDYARLLERDIKVFFHFRQKLFLETYKRFLWVSPYWCFNFAVKFKNGFRGDFSDVDKKGKVTVKEIHEMILKNGENIIVTVAVSYAMILQAWIECW